MVVEAMQAGSPCLVKSWGGCVFVVVEGVRAGSPHLVKGWGACCCGSGKGAGWQPALG